MLGVKILGHALDEFLDKFGGGFAVSEDWVANNRPGKGYIGFDAPDQIFPEGAVHSVKSELAGAPKSNDFGDHAIVVRGDRVTTVDM